MDISSARTSPSSDPGPLTLRRASPADAADFVRLMSDPEVFANLMQLPYPSAEDWRRRFEELPKADALHLVAVRAGVVVGSAGLHPADRVRRRHVAMLGISVALPAHGQGIGTALMQALCDYADGWAGIQRIELNVFSDNARAIALYQRFDFRLEGTHVGYAMRHGVFADSLSMARLIPRQPVLAWPAQAA